MNLPPFPPTRFDTSAMAYCQLEAILVACLRSNEIDTFELPGCELYQRSVFITLAVLLMLDDTATIAGYSLND